jgi:hypothetical protein
VENDKVSFYDLIISAAAEYIYMADENARRSALSLPVSAPPLYLTLQHCEKLSQGAV